MSRQSDRIGDRIAEEAQLLTEEKWIIEALTKIKNQRNCLQIERLQLESLQSKLLQRPENDRTIAEDCSQPQNDIQKPSASTATDQKISTAGKTRNSIEFEVPLGADNFSKINLDDCNDEELDLEVSKSVFSQEFKKNMLEEYDEEDEDDMFIDMNMFMNSKNAYGS